MPLIPEQILDEIQSRTDIAELIGRYVPLKRAGRHFKALCPFHKERTPSFHINADKQIFHCFGCGVGGNIFSFLIQHERLTFPEAVAQLAAQTGIQLPEPREAARNGRTSRLFEVLEKTCRYYERLLSHPTHGRTAREYLRKRGVSDPTREAFHLGCTPRRGDGLVQAAKRSRLSLELLEHAGLILQGPQGPLDRFRSRLMFPLHDPRGRVVGFGGRSLAGQEPKYLNGPETAVYTKGRQLFGLSQAKEAIARAKSALVVEGYLDCLLVWQSGVQQVVSPLGVALTPEQARLLCRYTERVVLAFDADAAGETAALRGLEVLVEAGLRVQVAQLPPGVDPDELVRAEGVEALQERVAKALNVMEFLIACARTRYDLQDSEGKVQAAQWILPTIAKVPNAMLREEYVRCLADRLHLEEPAVRKELGKAQPRSVREPSRPAPEVHRPGAEWLFTALILDQPARLNTIKTERVFEQISDERLRRIVAVIAQMREAHHGEPTPAQVISRLAEEGTGSLVPELVHLAQTVPAKEEAFRDCATRLLAAGRARELASLREALRLAQQRGQAHELDELLRGYQRLVNARPEGAGS